MKRFRLRTAMILVAVLALLLAVARPMVAWDSHIIGIWCYLPCDRLVGAYDADNERAFCVWNLRARRNDRIVDFAFGTHKPGSLSVQGNWFKFVPSPQ